MKTVLEIHEFRRSILCRSMVSVLVSSLVFGQVRVLYATLPSGTAKAQLPDDAARGFSQRLRPSGLSVGRAAAPDTLWTLFDGNGATGLLGGGATTFEAKFEESRGLSSVGVYGATAGRLMVKTPTGRVLAEKIFDAPSRQWVRLPLAADRDTTLVFGWTGRSEKSRLPALEVWGSVAPNRKAGSTPVVAGLPFGAQVFASNDRSRQVAGSSSEQDRSFRVTLNADPRAADRAFLIYRVESPRSPAQILRGLNDGPSVRGAVLIDRDQTVVEEISPRALAPGVNRIRFNPTVAADPIGSRVGEVRLAILRSSESKATATDSSLGDARESTVWNSMRIPTQSFSFETPSQPHELEFRLARESRGSLAVNGAAGTRVTVELVGLKTGWHRVNLDALPVVGGLNVGATGTTEAPVLITEMHVNGSPPPASEGPTLRLLEPQRGECVERRVDLRVLSNPRPVSLSVNGRIIDDITYEGDALLASISEDLVGKHGKPTVFDLAAVYPGGLLRKMAVHTEGCIDPAALADAALRPDKDAPFKVTVSAAKGGLVGHGEASLEIPPGALAEDTEITVHPLRASEAHALNPGMVNVTAKDQVFRFGPHNLKFKKPVRLMLPIDRVKVAAGDHVATLYFDETSRGWREVPRASSSAEYLASMTTHFTDFIAATSAMPEHPGVQSLNPTSIKDMKLSDPAAGVELMSPPSPNSQGTASVSYPIVIPPGRKGMQPELAITYDSQAGNGWLGVGWNLTVPTIEVDTRFGVPKYDGTERYLLNGQELAQLVGTTPAGAPAGGTYYVLRNESSFNWIQRISLGGAGFFWRITDKAGTKYTYGNSAGARLQPNTSGGSADPARAAKWFLETQEDMWGNQVRYTYTPDAVDLGASSSIPGSGERFYQVYPASIAYTATSHAGPGPQYSVVFGFASGDTNRTDATSNARFGFPVHTRRLLGTIDVKNGSTFVRRYTLVYKNTATTDFNKTLLDKIEVRGKGTTSAPGPLFATNTLAYFQTPRDQASKMRLFSQPYEGGLENLLRPYYGAAGTTPTTGTHVGPSLENSRYNANVSTMGDHVGTISNNFAQSDGTLTSGPGLIDTNGDGLPDLTALASGSVANIQGVGPGGPLGGRSLRFGAAPRPAWERHFSRETKNARQTSYNVGVPNLQLGGAQSYGAGTAASDILRDIDGDGLLDRVQLPGVGNTVTTPQSIVVSLGNGIGFGTPQAWTNYQHPQYGFQCNDVFGGGSITSTQALRDAGRPPADFPSVDTVIRWEAPYTGQVRITGPIQLQETGGDGVTATLLKGNTKVWERNIAGTDTTACVPAPAGTEPGSACWTSGQPILKQVTAGDRFYTRINARSNLDHDVITWNPTFEYTSTGGAETTSREAWGSYRYKFSRYPDSKAAGALYLPWTAPYDGTIRLTELLNKSQTSAPITLKARLVPANGAAAQDIQSVSFAADDVYSKLVVQGPAAATAVKKGDRLYVSLSSPYPYDPTRVAAAATVSYELVNRIDPITGQGGLCHISCGPGTMVSGSTSREMCQCDEADPDPEHPYDRDSLVASVVVHSPIGRWKLAPPSNPAATPDGRSSAFTASANPTLQVCGGASLTSTGQATAVIQGVNKLYGSIKGSTTGACLSVPSNAPAGSQIVFAVYAPTSAQLDPAAAYTAFINGVPAPVERYYVDPAVPLDTAFGSGQRDAMSGGMNGFSVGFWNGNFDFDQAAISATPNSKYIPAFGFTYLAPIPGAAPLSARGGASVAAFGGFLGNLYDAGKALVSGGAKVSEKIVSITTDPAGYALKATGIDVIAGGIVEDIIPGNVRSAVDQILSFPGKVLFWSTCMTSDALSFIPGLPTPFGSYTVDAISYAENQDSVTSLTASGISVAKNRTETMSVLDLVDMNGDGIGDDVSSGGILYGQVNPGGGTFVAPAGGKTALPGLGNPALRSTESNYFSTTANGSTSVPIDLGSTPGVASNSQGGTVSVSATPMVSATGGAGYAKIQRELVDINGDGLPDLVEKRSQMLVVYINFGYAFGKPIAWNVPDWAISQPSGPGIGWFGVIGSALPTNLQNAVFSQESQVANRTVELDQVASLGSSAGLTIGVSNGYVNGSVGGSVGFDHSYVMNLVRLVDVNGDGLPDQIMKQPGSTTAGAFWVKFNLGTKFAAAVEMPADAWPADFLFPLNEVDGLGVKVGASESWSANISGGWVAIGGQNSYGRSHGTGLQLLSLTDIDGDGLPDHVAKMGTESPNISLETKLRGSEFLVRYNQAGKSNLLQSVTNALGGGFELDYSREGNYVGPVALWSGRSENVDMQSSRWCLSSVFTFDNVNPLNRTSYLDRIEYDFESHGSSGTIGRSFQSSGFYDRKEKEFYGFSRVRVLRADGSRHMYYYLNDSYHRQGRPLAELESTPAGAPAIRGSLTQFTLGVIQNAVPSATYVKQLDQYEIKYPAQGLQLGDYDPQVHAMYSPMFHQTIKSFDSAGNMTTVADGGDSVVLDDDVTYQMTYGTTLANHFSPVTSIVASVPGAGGATLRRRDATFATVNGRPTLSQIDDTIIGGNQPVSGAAYTSAAALKTTHRFAFDTATGDFGNLRTYTDPSGYVLTYGYDATGTHLTSVTDNLGISSTSVINLDFGLPSSTTDANGQVVNYGYDVFGRTTDVWGPTDPTTGTATVHVDYSLGSAGGYPAWARTRNKDIQSTSNDRIDVATFMDGLGRIIQTKKEAEIVSGGTGATEQTVMVSGQMLFDNRGRVATKNDPVKSTLGLAGITTFEPVGPSNTETQTYDGIGRPLVKTFSDGWAEENIYLLTMPTWTYYPPSTLTQPLEVRAFRDPIGAYTWYYSDALDRQVVVGENAYFGGAWKGPQTFTTYDRFGNVATVKDAKLNVTAATYDSLNRMVNLTSPDAGMTEFRYGTNGLLMRKQTAALRAQSQWINYAYFANSTRLQTIDYPVMPDVAFTYGNGTTDKGNANGNIAGRIKTVTMEGGNEQRRYDAFGNVNQTVRTLTQFTTSLPSPTVTTKYSYDWMGRMQTMTFPKIINSSWSVPTGDGEIVSYVYDKGGTLKSITGRATPTSTPETYLTARTYDGLGRLAVDVAGNGIVTSRSYNPARHWLTGISFATSATAVPFQQTGFGVRADGLITSSSSTSATLAPDNQPIGMGTTTTIYDYDAIKELISSTSTYRGHATFGYQTQSSYVYDEIGNIVSKTQSDTRQNCSGPGSTTAINPVVMPNNTYGLVFNYAGPRPHAAASITETTSSGATVTHTVSHDGSGNNTGETAGASSRALVWDEADRLKRVDINGVAQGRFLYDADGERTQKQNPDTSTTFYFNQFLVIHGNRNVTKHIFAGIERIASKTESSSLATPVKHFYHSDQVGSTSYVTDGAQAFVQHERYFPFGEPWSDSTDPGSQERVAQSGVVRNWLFNSKEQDASGYYYYGARYYDSRNSRWLSPDPILAKYLAQGAAGVSPGNLGLYSYGWNNPVVMRDLDGRQAVPYPDLRVGAAQEVVKAAKQIGKDVSGAAQEASKGFEEFDQGRVPDRATTKSPFFRALGFTLGMAAAIFGGKGAKGGGKAGKAGQAGKAGEAIGKAEGLAGAAEGGIGRAISEGHAFEKHVVERGEFENLGIKTPAEFATHIDNVVKGASGENMRSLSNNRTAYWDPATGTVVIRNSGATDMGTAFRPANGRVYFEGLE